MSDEMLLPESSPPVVLHQARDALIYLDLVSEYHAWVELRGRITKIRKHGGVIFFNFEDATGSVQLMAQRRQFESYDWVQMHDLKPYSRVVAQGFMTRSKTGEPTVSLRNPLRPPGAPEREGDARTISDLDRVGVRLFLSRLRYKAEVFFRKNGFLQIEPNFISTSWNIKGIEPLRVQYEGFGVPTYLTPSPSSQIIAAMEATGTDRAFAVGRCFTTTYRDETTSAESLILMAKISHTNLEDLVNICQYALSATLGDPETMPDNYNTLMAADWQRVRLEVAPEPGRLSLLVPTIQVYHLPTNSTDPQFGSDRVLTILRACWPPRHVITEGFLESFPGSNGDGTITLFLERMIPLLKDVSVRQIRDLQKERD